MENIENFRNLFADCHIRSGAWFYEYEFGKILKNVLTSKVVNDTIRISKK